VNICQIHIFVPIIPAGVMDLHYSSLKVTVMNRSRFSYSKVLEFCWYNFSFSNGLDRFWFFSNSSQIKLNIMLL